MLKLLGSGLILAGGVTACTLQIRSIRRTLNTLRDLTASLSAMESAIRVQKLPLPRLVKIVGCGRGADTVRFFQGVLDNLGAGIHVAPAWESAARSLPLSQEERKSLAEVGRCFGGDGDAVCKAILLAREDLERSLRERELQRLGREKQCAALCLSGAALLIILLI